jgi:UDP-N-acetylmuramate-alanine ligase
MHLHILGICGTFMGGLAAIAKTAGHVVTGCDANVYPPMSTQLRGLGIDLVEGWDASQLAGVARGADAFVIGNVVSRGNPLMEAILDSGRRYVSGPQWLYENVLHDRWVLAVAGTHGKTTTTAMLAWILEDAGLNPGFLIGGAPLDFPVSARLTDSAFFAIEADEYDTAFFDKRSKFVHYRPRTAIFNNLEYDHADIFPDLAAIETQFHHLVRMIPPHGRIVAVLEPRSNTMKLGAMKDALPGSLGNAERVFCYNANLGWDVAGALAPLGAKATVLSDLPALVQAIAREAAPGDHVLVMSNGGFGGIHAQLLETLAEPG